MYKRFTNLKDYFIIQCKKCGSEDVDLTAEECHECGHIIKAEHDFEQIEVK